MNRDTARVNAILRQIDDLGFDSTAEARYAITGYADWRTRWDCSDVSADDLQIIARWRRATLSQYRHSPGSQSEPAATAGPGAEQKRERIRR